MNKDDIKEDVEQQPKDHCDIQNERAKEIKNNNEEYYCKTPTSSDHKIPKIQSCPSTPRKKQISLVNSINIHKRKFEFYETTNKEEVESFFRSQFFELKSSFKNKRCRSA
ncbi:hypothetical protein ACFE04_006704 [Oxalis oulophora]